jgi:hypothetical protein
MQHRKVTNGAQKRGDTEEEEEEGKKKRNGTERSGKWRG